MALQWVSGAFHRQSKSPADIYGHHLWVGLVVAEDSAIAQAGTIVYGRNDPLLRMMTVLNPQFYVQSVLALNP